MTIHYSDDSTTLHHGDCIEVLRTLPDCSVDSVVTDPPYGLEFMGREWDGADGFRRSLNPEDAGRDNAFGRASKTSPEYKAGPLFQQWCEAWASECLRVLKPGGHMVAFGGSRTWHRLAAAIEDSGFEIRDSIAWLYGSGFPKSVDVAKAITGTQLGYGSNSGAIRRATMGSDYVESGRQGNRDGAGRRDTGLLDQELELTSDAVPWEGWGTALKPGFEPIVVGRKPLSGTVPANVLAHGTGALNIDGCRIDGRERTEYGLSSATRSYGTTYGAPSAAADFDSSKGRWPTNVLLDESQAGALDAQSGVSTSRASTGKQTAKHGTSALGDFKGRPDAAAGHSDTGGASRFFPTFRYEAKAPTSERPSVDGVQHPTVKPLDLMRWLVRLVTPPNGVVLEPFAGSGTTAEACVHEHMKCIAVEREADYLPLIVARLSKPIEVGFDFGGVA
ncbi:hypothetical protein CH249_25860 [Rhodococcus sp. 05-2255-3B1]|uniref:DNA-methyltransferase n=1 Tax=Rhodococcus sp. 05-2255-3B1 TaxID=2022482 RepID=UPI000B9C06BA|nr:site-specific DNA-methyltransferase [Rhodococcus sp. 05-2255-3B1]OZE04362.1 hypothetical protein CH249_25860 [Rhodococcus sp. 05-2255-3B1]